MSHTVTHIGSRESDRAGNGVMRAGVYRGQGRVVVEEVAIPEIHPGEVLFRVAACGICGTDIKKIQHGFIKPPQILGHELAGTVVKTGAGVKKFKVGDRVVSFHHIPCGDCFYCEKKFFSQCAGCCCYACALAVVLITAPATAFSLPATHAASAHCRWAASKTPTTPTPSSSPPKPAPSI